jgi:3-phosphoshikimate 1-carboxyvinyltransferase
MALAFAPAALKVKNLVINDAMVITKSYPRFWNDLRSVGFEINEKLE